MARGTQLINTSTDNTVCSMAFGSRTKEMLCNFPFAYKPTKGVLH